jgi:DNA polymerase
MKLHIDFESRSVVDLKRAGVYVYAEDESTDVWCAAYAVDEGPIHLWTPGGECPRDIAEAVAQGHAIIAHNAAFERVMWKHILTPRYGWPEPKLEQWRCTMAMAYALALPGSLENAAAAVGLEARKDMDGHGLMMRMARPRRARKGEYPGKTYWFDDEDRKQRLYAYCKNDVAVERELEKRLLPLRPTEQELWWLDQKINDRGVHVDVALCEAALKVVDRAAGWLDDEMRDVTGGAVSACSNVGEITGWLRDNGVPDIDSIAKDVIDELLARQDLRSDARRVLELRREAAKASVAKIDALLAGKSRNGRAKGLLQYHAASTGRWAGRRFQPQNIKRPDLEDVDGAIAAVSGGDADVVRLLYGEPLSVVGDCLRGMVCAAPGRQIMAADFSNIEGRVQAWYGGEEWKLKAFRDYDAGTGHDIYKLAYAKSFGIAPEDVDKLMRQIGKVMELALGYAGGVGAFQKMAVGYGLQVSDAKADELKVAWRAAHPGIKQYWYDLQDAACEAVERRGEVIHCGKVAFRVAGSFCFMRLPSGRAISYPYPRVEMREVPWKKNFKEWVPCDSRQEAVFLYGTNVEYDDAKKRAHIYKNAQKPTFIYKGTDPYTRKWCDQEAHGGVLFNNVVQGTARDVQAEAMTRLEAAGYPVILTVHDEVVAEPAIDAGSIEEFERLMTQLPAWAEGLPVAAEAWAGPRYKK